jgi:hypothetical protein
MEDGVSREDSQGPPTLSDINVRIDNWEMVTGEEFRKVMDEGGVLKRGPRHSLTCRDVERVTRVKSFGVGRR